MIDKKKIIIMSEMAVHDKQFREKDSFIYEYFRGDYIYRKNMWTRVCAFVSGLILLMFYWTYRIFVEELDVFALDFQKIGYQSAVFLFALLVIYSLIGTVQATAAYNSAEKRSQKYAAMVTRLAKHEKKIKSEAHSEEAASLYYGADLFDKRNNNKPV